MIAILVVSTAGYSLYTASDNNAGSVEEQGHTFVLANRGFITVVEGVEYGFRFLPSSVADVPVSGFFDISEYNSASTVLYFTAPSGESTNEILSNLARFTLRYQGACLNGTNSCTGDYPTKTCQDTIFIEEPGNMTAVKRLGNCIYLQGDTVKAADAFLYKLLKIT